MTRPKTKKVKKSDIGRFVRVLFDDVGAVDGLITQVDGPNDLWFIELGKSEPPEPNNGATVIALGNRIKALDSGLDKG